MVSGLYIKVTNYFHRDRLGYLTLDKRKKKIQLKPVSLGLIIDIMLQASRGR